MAVEVGNSNPSNGGHQSQAVTHLHRDINRRIVDASTVVRVLDIVEDASRNFNAVNISTAFHRLARMWRDLPDLTASAPHGQSRLDNALQTLMQLAVSHIKEVMLICTCLECWPMINCSPQHAQVTVLSSRQHALIILACLSCSSQDVTVAQCAVAACSTKLSGHPVTNPLKI